MYICVDIKTRRLQKERKLNANAKMNPGFLNLKKSYLFIEIGKRVREYIAAHPDNKIIKMGIGDVTQPLAPV